MRLTLGDACRVGGRAARAEFERAVVGVLRRGEEGNDAAGHSGTSQRCLNAGGAESADEGDVALTSEGGERGEDEGREGVESLV